MKPLHWTLDGHLSGLEAGRVDISSLLYYEALDVQCLAWKQMTIRIFLSIPILAISHLHQRYFSSAGTSETPSLRRLGSSK